MIKSTFKKKFLKFIISGFFLASSTGCGRSTSFSPNLLEPDTYNSFAEGKVRTPKADTLTLTTYNISNLFITKSEKQKVALSKAIREINSDIIAFEEVESKTVLKNFTDNYLKDLKYNLYMNDAPGKVKVAVLSRFPVSEVKSLNKAGKTAIPEDKVAQLNFKIDNNYNFTLFVAYLKALGTPGYTPEKRNEDILNMKAFFKGYQTLKANFAILANLNEKPDSRDLQVFLDPRSSGLNFHDIITEDLGSGPDSATVLKPQKIRTDYLLVSAGMFNEYTINSVVIHKPVKEGNTWKNLFFQDASDHLPVTAKFDISSDN